MMKRLLYLNLVLLLALFLAIGCQSTLAKIPGTKASSGAAAKQTTDVSLYNKVPASMKADVKEAEFDLKQTKANVNRAKKKVEIADLKRERSVLQKKYADFGLQVANATQRGAEVNVELKQWEAIDAAGLGDKESNIKTIANLKSKQLKAEDSMIQSKASLETTGVKIKKISKRIHSLESKLK
jgi:chromosome segregation ATPase